MKIILASPRGFCAGVNRAISALEEAVKHFGTPFYVYHEIVHNTWVVQDFERRGVHFVSTLEDVPENSNLMFSAHGVSPKIRDLCSKKNIHVIDATCPLVARLHNQAIRLASEGFHILLIGHRGHDEVVGIVEEVPEVIQVIGTLEEAQTFTAPQNSHLAYLTQTTLSTIETQQIISVLKRRFPDIRAPHSECICFATQNRQKAILELASQADVVLIVGSATSSNSRRLCEIASLQGIPSYLVDGAKDVDFSWFSKAQTVLISAGASAPEWVVDEVVNWIGARIPTEIESCSVSHETLQFRLPPME